MASGCRRQLSGVGAGLQVPGYTAAQVEEVRFVIRLLPVFFTTILYWTVYAQMGTFFIMQVASKRGAWSPVTLSP